MKSERYYIPKTLLTTKNKKLLKGENFGYTTYGLSLAPFTQNSQGKNVCPMASTGCAAACLFTSGHGSMSTVKKERINKTEFFLADHEKFLNKLYVEIATIEFKHKMTNTNFVIRLNVTSDISWEKFKIKDGKNIFELFPNVQFYDYTKNHLRFKNELPANYHLTFSRSETNHDMAMALLAKGVNVSIVFDKVPANFEGYNVIDGDKNDLRFLDDKKVIVGLKYKKMTGKGADNKVAFESGFAIRMAA